MRASAGSDVYKTRYRAGERPDVGRLLAWAEVPSQGGREAGLAAQAAQLGVADLASVEFALHDGIKAIVRDSLLGRAPASNTHLRAHATGRNLVCRPLL